MVTSGSEALDKDEKDVDTCVDASKESRLLESGGSRFLMPKIACLVVACGLGVHFCGL